MPTLLPLASEHCPMLAGTGSYVFGDPDARTLTVQVYVATDAREKPGPGGPLMLYWHAFGSGPAEVLTGVGQEAIDEVVAQGGMVAAFTSKLCATCGVIVDDTAWYIEDHAVSDELVGCAIAQAHIDVRRIHSLGLSAGGMHSLRLAFERAHWIASVVSYSGGLEDPERVQSQDPDNRVPALLTYGREGVDAVGIDFAVLGRAYYDTFRARGYYVMSCNHGGGHMIPADFAPYAFRFLLDHPYRVAPEPYAQRIPLDFPAYCSNMRQ